MYYYSFINFMNQYFEIDGLRQIRVCKFNFEIHIRLVICFLYEEIHI